MGQRGHGIYDTAAHLYDIAFSWDVRGEAAWLAGQWGDAARVLEPACGSGRLFPALQALGIEVVGIERSAEMIGRARRRMAALDLPEPQVHAADMARFDLGQTFDGALLPINSLGYLHTADLVAGHLESVARHLDAGRRYMVQVDLQPTDVSIEYARGDCSRWDVVCGRLTVRTTWCALSFDPMSGLQTETARVEVLPTTTAEEDPPAARWELPPGACLAEDLALLEVGTVFEERHVVRKWSFAEWAALVAASPFELLAAHDGTERHDPLPLDEVIEDEELTWFTLQRRA